MFGHQKWKEPIPTRHSLLDRLKDGHDQEAWRVFFDTYWKLIYNTAIRAGLTESEAQDVVQETVIGVSKNIPEFVYDPAKGTFKAWLLRQTTWRIADQFRKRLPTPEPGANDGKPRTSSEVPATTTLERVPDPAVPALEALWEKEWEENLVDAAFRRVKAQANPKQYQAFELCVRHKWPASKVASDLHMNAARVYLAKHRLSNLLKKELLELKTKPV
jgi:RNA polymerase sigma-70 factor (ECF subfamily)